MKRIYLLLKLAKLWEQTEKQIRKVPMKLSVNSIIQLLGVATQVVVQVQDIVPSDFKPYAVGSIGIIQGIAAILGHFSKLNGKPLENDSAN